MEQSIEMDAEDSTDFEKMLQLAKSESVDLPEHLKSLIVQQRQILETESKNRYRWHPE